MVASSLIDKSGTIICGGDNMQVGEQQNKVSGIVDDLDVAKITVVGVPDRPGVSASIFVPLSKAGISVDTIVQNVSIAGITDLTFTVTRGEIDRAIKVVNQIIGSIGARSCVGDTKVGKVSVVGTGMQNKPGYAATMFETLSAKGINIDLITTSEIRISCLIAESKVKDAVRALHKAFELETP
jgi:aspartate kinase